MKSELGICKQYPRRAYTSASPIVGALTRDIDYTALEPHPIDIQLCNATPLIPIIPQQLLTTLRHII